MATRFDFAIDPATHDAAKRMAPAIHVVSAERIAEELRKLFVHPNRARGLRLLRELDLIEPILPELSACGERDRAVRVVEGLAADTNAPVPFPLAFAAALNALDASTVEAIAGRLKLSTAETVRLCWLVENRGVLLDAPTMRASRLKSLLVHPGIGDLLALHRAIARAGGTTLAHVEFCERMIRETPPEVLNPPPVLTGEDLIALALKPGPAFKRLLDAVREAQLEGRVTTKEEALALVRQLLA
jgi:poly(A) polymerase